MKGKLQRSPRMARIGSYMLLNVEQVAFGNLARIARETNVSGTTAMRFVNALGFDHFSDLQALFRAHLLHETDNHNSLENGAAASEHGRVLSAICEAAGLAIGALPRSIAADVFAKAVSKLAVRGIIYVIGKESAFPIVAYFHTLLLLIGVRTELLESPLNNVTDFLRFVTPDDVVLAASFTPYERVTVDLVQSLSGRSIATVVITDNSFSPLAVPGAIRLEVVEPSISGYRIPSTSVAVVEALAAAIGQRRCAGDEGGQAGLPNRNSP